MTPVELLANLALVVFSLSVVGFAIVRTIIAFLRKEM